MCPIVLETTEHLGDPLRYSIGLQSNRQENDDEKTFDPRSVERSGRCRTRFHAATYVIHAEIPGAKKDDVKIDVDDNFVSIAAQLGNQVERKNGGRWICTERFSGSVSRSMSLPHDVDPSKANAAYENGVLALTLPKKARSSAKSVPIR
jgi:HSP20 family protein